MAPPACNDVSAFTRGKRCAVCHRYLFTFHHPRPSEGRQWEHLSCEGLEPPEPLDFAELAEVLVARHATTLTRQLRDEMTVLRNAFQKIRFRDIVAEHDDADGPREPEVNRELAELSARCAVIHEQLLEQLRGKARKLHEEWMTGTDADGLTTAPGSPTRGADRRGMGTRGRRMTTAVA
jgi:hypothetical protein